MNTEHCVVATVTDLNGAPVAGVRVDFVAGGSNSAIEFVTSAADGTALFCYLGSNLGNDTIVASVGSVTATASVDWVTALTTQPNFTG